MQPDPVEEKWRWKVLPDLKGVGVRCIAQEPDGMLWVGTGRDVRRYDGIRRTIYSEKDKWKWP